MAIEFGSRKENFDNFKVYETTLAGRPFKVEMGKMCGLSNASALIRYGETCVMCNVVMSPKPREGVDFFPLNVEYEEKLYAAGRIPGSFMRREGRPGERAILTSRVVDRPMRPLFPKEMRNDVCITMTVMSLDPDCSPEIAGMIGASLVTAVSEIPWNGPIGGVQVGLVDGEIVLNPTQEQRKKSDLALTVAATMDKIVMIEAGANEVDEDTMLNAIKAAHVEIKKIITFINGIVAERGKPKIDFQVVGLDMDVFHAIKEKYLDDFKAAMDTDDKNVRDAALLPIMDKIAEEYPDLTEADLDLVSYKMQKYVVRRWLLDEGKRVDGRGINEIRPLAAEVGILPRVHGSGMFTRGQTQVLTTCTLGGTPGGLNNTPITGNVFDFFADADRPAWSHDEATIHLDNSDVEGGSNTRALADDANFCYDIFPGVTPQLLVQLNDTTDAGSPVPYYLATEGFSGLSDNTFKAGYIYNVNFSFKWNDPLTPEKCVTVNVTVEPWTVEAITPEF